MPHLQGWPDTLRALVQQSDPASLVYVSFFDRLIAATWGRGAVTTIGDAVHPFVPNLGQGACQAIEDGHTVAAGLVQGLRGEALTAWLSHKRTARVRYMRRKANSLGTLAQSTSAVLRASLGLLATAPMRSIIYSDLSKQFTPPQGLPVPAS